MRENIMIGIWKIFMKMMTTAITAVMIKIVTAGALIPIIKRNRVNEC